MVNIGIIRTNKKFLTIDILETETARGYLIVASWSETELDTLNIRFQ
jgi:hypothetical protein